MPDEPGLSPIENINLQSIRRSENKRAARIRYSWVLLAIALISTSLVATFGIIIPKQGIVAASSLTVVAGIFQVLSVIVASGSEVDSNVARMQLLNGLKLTANLNELRTKVEETYEQGTTEQRRRLLGNLVPRSPTYKMRQSLVCTAGSMSAPT
jgi:hypothetical protein